MLSLMWLTQTLSKLTVGETHRQRSISMVLKELNARGNLTQNCYNIPRKIQVEEQNCRFEPKKFCELEMKAKKYSYTKDCKEQPREICDQCEKKALRRVFENQQRLECKYYKPAGTRTSSTAKVEKVVLDEVCDMKFATSYL